MSETQQLLLVTGMSGAGKSTALKVLEDLGWEAVDNFPIRLLKLLVKEVLEDNARVPFAVGFDARTRGFVPTTVIDKVKRLTNKTEGVAVTTLFIDCDGPELERRYNETRRRHPMAEGRTAADGIRAERELLEPLKRWADIVIDTSELAANELQMLVRQHFKTDETPQLSLTVSSFGFARGMPPLADLVFDMRFLDNPHWEDKLREQTGLDPEVGEYLEHADGFRRFFRQIHTLLLDLLPRYRAQGKSYVHIAFGCTGGRHRSVYTAEKMAQALREEGFSLTVLHRNLTSRAADAIEQSPA